MSDIEKARAAFCKAFDEEWARLGCTWQDRVEVGLLAAKEFLQDQCKRCDNELEKVRSEIKARAIAQQPAAGAEFRSEDSWPQYCAHGKHIYIDPRCEKCEAANLSTKQPQPEQCSTTTVNYSEPKKECSHYWIMRDEGKVCDWCGTPKGPQPEAAGDLVERMLDAFYEDARNINGPFHKNAIDSMTRALAVAREEFGREREQSLREQEERLLREPSQPECPGQIERKIITDFLKSRRTKVTKTIEERVTIGAGEDDCAIYIDGEALAVADNPALACMIRNWAIANLKEKDTNAD